MQYKITPVLLSGGSGTRLWPLSRERYPKQLLQLNGDNSMLQATLSRLEKLANKTKPIVICNSEHRFMVAEQLRQIGTSNANIILEPVGRNTAPAIAFAAIKAMNTQSDATLLVLPADHNIQQSDKLIDIITKSVPIANNGSFVSFGIVPTYPETGYGYIKRGAAINAINAGYQIQQFVEKPDLTTAEQYFNSGEYYWNSGMFLFKASSYLDKLQQFRPDIYSACQQAMANETTDLDFIRIDEQAVIDCPADSIDYAVMEKLQAADTAVMPLAAGWSDFGSFKSLYSLKPKDNDGNACDGDVKTLDTENSLVISEDKLVVTIGVKNLTVVSTKDAVLVADIDKCQQVKTIVNQLKAENRSEYQLHREVYRPWGSYDTIDSGTRYQVKRISVKAGAKLSLQKHHHRAEHWVVVSGTAKVTIGDKQMLLTENQSTYIPIGEVHSLENPGKIDLELIEVQSGAYLDEDDIVRLQDNYGRE